MDLQLDHLRLHYGALDFHYHARLNHGITGIFGCSGSGKTTLLHILGGMVTPRSGQVVFNDHIFFDHSKHINIPAHRRRIGVVFQDHYLFPHLTVRQNLNYSRPYVGHHKQLISFESILALLDLEGLLDKKSFQLSGGERQRVAIGRALLSQPRLLLLDEPFSNLDKPRRMQIISYLLKIHNRLKIPMLIVSHDLDDMLKLTQDLLVIKDRAVAAGGAYMDMVEKGLAPEIISPKDYLNVLELSCLGYAGLEDLYLFGPDQHATQGLIKTTVANHPSPVRSGTRVRFGLAPDEIALSTSPIPHSSIQNQVQGRIEKILCHKQSCYVTVNCGFPLVAEITTAAGKSMPLQPGAKVYALIKAKALHVLHVYDWRPQVEVHDLSEPSVDHDPVNGSSSGKTSPLSNLEPIGLPR